MPSAGAVGLSMDDLIEMMAALLGVPIYVSAARVQIEQALADMVEGDRRALAAVGITVHKGGDGHWRETEQGHPGRPAAEGQRGQSGPAGQNGKG